MDTSTSHGLASELTRDPAPAAFAVDQPSAPGEKNGGVQGSPGSHEEREESDDDPDQDDDFDDEAETAGQARRPRSVLPATAWFHSSVHHDRISLGHYYFDPRPPRRC